MKERPILFNGEMVRAVLAGTKSQTRRLVTPANGEQRRWLTKQGIAAVPAVFVAHAQVDDPRSPLGVQLEHPRGGPLGWIRCPYGAPGDRLWVREAFGALPEYPDALTMPEYEGGHNATRLIYRADEPLNHVAHYGIAWERIRWTPSLHMPRWASRITLEIVDVRVERVTDISEEDAKAEGVRPFFETFDCFARDQCLTTGERAADAEHRASFAVLWDEINGDRALWKSRPWVWALTFRRVTQ